MFMVFVDICLEKEGIFGGEAGAWCLSSGSSRGGCGTLELVLTGRM